MGIALLAKPGTATKGTATPGADAASVIAAGTIVDGELRFSGRLQVDGTVKGMVRADPIGGSELVIGPDGVVDGGAIVASIVLAGRLSGEVIVEQRLEVLAGARIDARVSYRDIQIHHGARVAGSLAAIDGDAMALRLQAPRRGA